MAQNSQVYGRHWKEEARDSIGLYRATFGVWAERVRVGEEMGPLGADVERKARRHVLRSSSRSGSTTLGRVRFAANQWCHGLER